MVLVFQDSGDYYPFEVLVDCIENITLRIIQCLLMMVLFVIVCFFARREKGMDT